MSHQNRHFSITIKIRVVASETDHVTGQSLGYGFLELENETQATAILNATKDNELSVQNRRLTVQYANNAESTRPPSKILFIRSFKADEKEILSALSSHAEHVESVDLSLY